MAFEIRAQNAGVLISNDGSDNMAFELFELAPDASTVMATIGSLQRSFFRRVILIPRHRYQERSFQVFLVNIFDVLDTEELPGAIPTITKAGSEVPEIRDTAHPRYVTELLAEILCALGQEEAAQTLHKNTRDDVLWKKCLRPWRRSPLWLLVRVMLQRIL